MPGALPMPLRHQIMEQKSRGNSLLVLSGQLHCSYATVRNIWKRFQAEGVQGLMPHYDRCGPLKPNRNDLIYRAALWLKRLHQLWGASFIGLMLQERYPYRFIPTARTLQRWFKAQGLYKVKSCFPATQQVWAERVHDIWQVDAKEQLHLASAEKACYLTLVDEKSGCLLRAFVFPPLSYQ
jgi:hypothetical protein